MISNCRKPVAETYRPMYWSLVLDVDKCTALHFDENNSNYNETILNAFEYVYNNFVISIQTAN